MDYDLTRLSWRSFEHLVQALSAAMFGPGIVIFGDGRDGGREATFRGSIEYSPTMNWEGYTVVQAKFRQRPEGTTPDGRWAEAQLRSELASYQNENGRPRPDNYIFATNVILGSSESGQKDRCVQALASASETLGITNYDIWDYDKIKTLLDLHDGVRKAYRAWITSGDVLSQLLEDHDQAARGANAALTSYLAKELLADHYVNLEQAGHAVEEKIPLSRVFVDLPSAPAAMSEQGLHGEGQGVVRRVLELASEKLDGEALQGASEAGRAPGALTPTQRLVLKGGPGQGKTTVGQFICQVLRAALLREASSTAITEEARQALAALDGHCQDQNLAFPAARRFPVRVVLNTFASALAKPSGPKTLLDFIYESVERRSSDSLPRPSLQELLETYPWLVVLDGLDEVPASSNRTQVLESISDFWSDVAANNVDILVVATTRPQGYNDDFAPDRYHHEQLLPLTPSRALDYGERLTKARFPGDDARQEKILKRLKRAASSDTTARLMTSPLQVTIMTALVDQRGQPPQERWSLFHDYYNVIFHREMERDIPAASILRDYRPDVDAIHHRVGLLLQALVEQRSHTEARLSSSDLAAIVRTRLSEEGHQDPQAAKDLEQRILEAARDRLVFLVGLESDRVGFEIRSLQEFMAAEGLMNGDQTLVNERLSAIAFASSWRNVFLFAAGKCFADAQYLRGNVYSICAALNTFVPGQTIEEDVACQSLTGSVVALELLHDGPARRQPKYARMFAEQALMLLKIADPVQCRSLAEAYEPDFEDLYKDAVARQLDSEIPQDSVGALQCLVIMSQNGVEWARDVLEANWARAEDTALPLLTQLFRRATANYWYVRQAGEPTDNYASRLVTAALHRTTTRVDAREILEIVGDYEHYDGGPIAVAGCRDSEFGYILTGAEPTRVSGLITSGPAVVLLEAGARFRENPTAMVLGSELGVIAVQPFRPDWYEVVGHLLPWQLASCLRVAGSVEEIKELSTRALEGSLGDRTQWRTAEERWQVGGVREPDVKAAEQSGLLWGPDIDTAGFPFLGASWRLGTDSTEAYAAIGSLMSTATSERLRSHFANIAMVLLGMDARSALDLDGVLQLARTSIAFGGARIRVGALANVRWPRRRGERVALLEELGRYLHLGRSTWRSPDEEPAEVVRSRVLAATRRAEAGPGLLRLLAACGVGQGHSYTDRMDVRPTDDGSNSGALSLVEVMRGSSTADLQISAQRFVAALPVEPDLLALLRFAMQMEMARWTPFVVAVSRVINASEWRGRRMIVDLLKEVGAAFHSPLVSQQKWNELGLFEQTRLQGNAH